MIDALKRGKWVAYRCLVVAEKMDPDNKLLEPLRELIEANVNKAIDEAVTKALEAAVRTAALHDGDLATSIAKDIRALIDEYRSMSKHSEQMLP